MKTAVAQAILLGMGICLTFSNASNPHDGSARATPSVLSGCNEIVITGHAGPLAELVNGLYTRDPASMDLVNGRASFQKRRTPDSSEQNIPDIFLAHLNKAWYLAFYAGESGTKALTAVGVFDDDAELAEHISAPFVTGGQYHPGVTVACPPRGVWTTSEDKNAEAIGSTAASPAVDRAGAQGVEGAAGPEDAVSGEGFPGCDDPLSAQHAPNGSESTSDAVVEPVAESWVDGALSRWRHQLGDILIYFGLRHKPT